MPLITATCNQCGGALSIDCSYQTASCPFCGTTFFIKHSKDNELDEIHAQIDGLIRIKDYSQALVVAIQLTKDYPQDLHGWLYCAILCYAPAIYYASKEIDDTYIYEVSSHLVGSYRDSIPYMKNAFSLASQSEIEHILSVRKRLKQIEILVEKNTLSKRKNG